MMVWDYVLLLDFYLPVHVSLPVRFSDSVGAGENWDGKRDGIAGLPYPSKSSKSNRKPEWSGALRITNCNN